MKKLLILCIFSPLHIFAQDLTTEVVVDRSVAVELPAASPVPGVGPTFVLPQQHTPTLQVSDYTMTADFNPSVAQVNPPVYTGVTSPAPYRGYAWLGYFPAYNLTAGAGYRVLDSKSDRLDVALGFEGASWHGNGVLKKPDVEYNTVNLLGGYSHNFKGGAMLHAKAAYTYDALIQPFIHPDGEDASKNYSHGDFEVGICNKGNIAYSAKAYYSFFNMDGSTKAGDGFETIEDSNNRHLGLDGHIATRVSDLSTLIFKASIDYLDAKGIHSLTNRVTHPKTWLIKLNPTFNFSKSNIDIRLGLQLDWSSAYGRNKLGIAPTVGALWHATDWGDVYVDMTGGQRLNTLSELYNYSVFAPCVVVSDPMHTKIDAVIGARVGSFGGFSADIHAGYAASNDVVLPSAAYLGSYIMTQAVETHDITGWRAGAKLKYEYSSRLWASLEGEVYTHGYNKGYWQSMDNARAKLCAEINIKPIERLSITAKYTLRASRFAYIKDYNGYDTIDLGNISDIDLHASYRFSDRISFFVRFDNLLCRRYLILPGVPSRRLHGLIGASYMF